LCILIDVTAEGTTDIKSLGMYVLGMDISKYMAVLGRPVYMHIKLFSGRGFVKIIPRYTRTV